MAEGSSISLSGSIRQRKSTEREGRVPSPPSAGVEDVAAGQQEGEQEVESSGLEAAAALSANTHWFVRIIFIRSLALVYCE